jgi:hypothetical protein
MGKEARVDELIAKWNTYRTGNPEPERYLVLSRDLYNIRNDVVVTPPFPDDLNDPDPEVMAAVEHYYLCRGWVGNGVFPASQVANMVVLYDLGKLAHVTPRHNKSKPVTPMSWMQFKYQNKGMNDGSRDAKRFNVDTPILWKKPPKYF